MGRFFRRPYVLDESGSFSSPLDVRVTDRQIDGVGPELESRDDISIDFSGLWLMLGVFDCHAQSARPRPNRNVARVCSRSQPECC